MRNGISIIILARDAALRLERLLSSILELNTHAPVEMIILDQSSTDSTTEVLVRHAASACIRHIIRGPGTGPVGLYNEAVVKARYPFLLFLANDSVFTRDFLPQALKLLEEDLETGALSADPPGPDRWPVRQDDLWPGGSSSFLLCRKSDFESLSGFRPEADFLFLDFCERLDQEFSKKRRSMNDKSGIKRQAPEMIRLRYHPDFSRGNPYQRLLYEPFPRHFQIRPASLEGVLKEMRTDQTGSGFVFHQHWTNPVLRGAATPEEARERMAGYLDKLDAFRDLGGVLVWTVHNILPHETRYPELEQELCQALVKRARVVHVHSPRVPELTREGYEIPLSKMLVAFHGNYIGVYPASLNKEHARQELGLALNCPVFLFLGQIRSYKGLHRLSEAFEACLQEFPEARLLLAGKVKGMATEELQSQFAGINKVHLHPGYVPDHELGLYLLAADYMVLPYERVLTSGSLILAQSFGLPPIVPNLGLLPDHVQDGQNGYIYDHEDPDGLTRAMLRALQGHDEHADLCSHALRTARSLHWEHTSAVLSARISSEVFLLKTSLNAGKVKVDI